MDNLDRDVREARRLGYGVRYGRYKADHPHTKPDPNAQVEEPEIRKCRFAARSMSVTGFPVWAIFVPITAS